MTIPNTLKTQVGGNHYKKYAIQPLEFAEKIELQPICFSAFKYVVRYKDKNGVEDLDKAIHCLDIHDEIGKEKFLYVSLNKMTEFLEQFSYGHANAMYLIFRSQTNKNYIDEAKRAIELLKTSLQAEETINK